MFKKWFNDNNGSTLNFDAYFKFDLYGNYILTTKYDVYFSETNDQNWSDDKIILKNVNKYNLRIKPDLLNGKKEGYIKIKVYPDGQPNNFSWSNISKFRLYSESEKGIHFNFTGYPSDYKNSRNNLSKSFNSTDFNSTISDISLWYYFEHFSINEIKTTKYKVKRFYNGRETEIKSGVLSISNEPQKISWSIDEQNDNTYGSYFVEVEIEKNNGEIMKYNSQRFFNISQNDAKNFDTNKYI
ncbi:hypothetical protein [Mycoplasma leonicaptivi]|uniref:hypothetical protein n=1 Tax=Mycoplasma leonicaptivi TaxID=36742 RepID=UPI000487B62D|nr:hypothetical protein [Mycoplasma leonicaptivi]